MQQSDSQVIVRYPQARKWWQPPLWSPFDKHGNVNIVYVVDTWWMKFWARITRRGAWTKLGAMTDG